jgi:hypothetical protein
MSMRTIIEFNHDYAHLITDEGPEFVAFLRQALNSGSERDWEKLRHFGVRRALMAHHSQERKVSAGGKDYVFP